MVLIRPPQPLFAIGREWPRWNPILSGFNATVEIIMDSDDLGLWFPYLGRCVSLARAGHDGNYLVYEIAQDDAGDARVRLLAAE